MCISSLGSRRLELRGLDAAHTPPARVLRVLRNRGAGEQQRGAFSLLQLDASVAEGNVDGEAADPARATLRGASWR
jgi:hypothetical protein